MTQNEIKAMNNEDKFSSAKKWTSNRELSSPTECERAFIAGAEWKDEQLADYLQQEWDRCAGACSSIVSAHCRDVEQMANDLGIKLNFNNPYIE